MMQGYASAPSRDPAMAADAPDSSADTGGDTFKVCIAGMDDGTYSVYVEDSDQDSQDQPQTANSVDEALKIAAQLIQQEQGEDQNAPMSKEDAQGYWDQLAAKKAQGNGQNAYE